MKRILTIPIPYEYLVGQAEIAQQEKMSDIQKRIAAMIISYKELDIASITLKEAIEKVFGLKIFNQIIIKKEVISLLNKNCNSNIINPFEELVGMIALNFNKDVTNKIMQNEKYLLLSKKSFTKKVEILVPKFKDFKYEEDIRTNIVSAPENVKFKSQIDLSKEQKEDVVSRLFHTNINEDQLVKSETLLQENEIIWKKYNIKFEINNDDILIESSIGNHILNLVEKNLLKIDLEDQLNKEITNLELQNKKIGNVIEFDQINENNLFASPLIESKFYIENNNIHVLYETSKKVNLNSLKINIKYINEDVLNCFNFIEKSGIDFDKEFIDLLSQDQKNQFILYILENNKPLINVSYNDFFEYINYDFYKTFSNDIMSNLLKNKIMLSMVIDKFGNLFDSLQLQKFQKITETSYKDMLNLFNIKYKNQPIFYDWDLEKKLFKIIDSFNTDKYSNLTKSELSAYKTKFENEIDVIFKDQNVYKDIFDKIKVLMNNASEWSANEIDGYSNALRKKIEKVIVDFGGNNKKQKFGVLVDKYINKEKADILKKTYKKLSEVFMHSNDKISLVKKENLLKKLTLDINKILPLSRKDKKDVS